MKDYLIKRMLENSEGSKDVLPVITGSYVHTKQNITGSAYVQAD